MSTLEMETVIGPFEATDVRLDPSPSVSGIPSMTGVMGTIEALRRTVAPQADQNQDVIVVLHDVQVKPGRFKPAPDSKGKPTEVPESISGTVRASLIVRGLGVPGTEAAAVMQRSRFCGGRVQMLPNAWHWNKMESDISDVLSRLPGGFVLKDRSDLLDKAESQESDDRDNLDVLLDCITRIKNEEGEISRPVPGWIVPVAVGYQSLEPTLPPRYREGTRNGEVPHLFVEDLIGLGELTSIRSVAAHIRMGQEISGLRWKWSINMPQGEFLITAR